MLLLKIIIIFTGSFVRPMFVVGIELFIADYLIWPSIKFSLQHNSELKYMNLRYLAGRGKAFLFNLPSTKRVEDDFSCRKAASVTGRTERETDNNNSKIS